MFQMEKVVMLQGANQFLQFNNYNKINNLEQVTKLILQIFMIL